MRDRLRHANVNSEIIDELCGWSMRSVGQKYGIGHTLEQKHKALNTILYTPHELLNINCLQISVLYMSMTDIWCPHTALIALIQQQFTPRVSNINRIADSGSFAMAIICTLICIHTK